MAPAFSALWVCCDRWSGAADLLGTGAAQREHIRGKMAASLDGMAVLIWRMMN